MALKSQLAFSWIWKQCTMWDIQEMEIRSRVDVREQMVRNGGVREMWRPTRNTVSATCTGAAPVQESLWKLKTVAKISRKLALSKAMFLLVLLFLFLFLLNNLLQGMIIVSISPFLFSMLKMIPLLSKEDLIIGMIWCDVVWLWFCLCLIPELRCEWNLCDEHDLDWLMMLK